MVKTYWLVEDELDETHTKEIIEGSGFVAVEVLKKSEVETFRKSFIKTLDKEIKLLEESDKIEKIWTNKGILIAKKIFKEELKKQLGIE